MTSQKYLELFNNPSSVNAGDVPVLAYSVFYELVTGQLKDEAMHCIAYYGVEAPDSIMFYCCVADDTNGRIRVFAHEQKKAEIRLKSLTPVCPQLHIFEREIHENYGVEFTG